DEPGGDPAVVVIAVLPPQRELPADLGLEVEGALAPFEGSPVEGAAGPAGDAGAVQEHTRAVDQPGHELALLGRARHAPGPTRAPELPLLGREGLGQGDGPVAVVLVDEVGAVRAAALHELGGR